MVWRAVWIISKIDSKERNKALIPFLAIACVFAVFLSFSIKFTIFAHGFNICTFSKIYCSIVSQSPPRRNRKATGAIKI